MNWLKSNFGSRWLLVVIGTILVAGCSIPTIIALNNGATINDFLINLGTEMAGALVTFILISGVFDWYRQQEIKKETDDELSSRLAKERELQKRRLIRQMSNPDHGLAMQAIEELDLLGHTRDGSLKGEFLSGENLSGLTLMAADLEGVKIVGMKLNKASLIEANLMNANIQFTDFRDSQLWGADLREAALIYVNLENTQLFQADLRGSTLDSSNLKGASFEPDGILRKYYSEAILDSTTILPDNSNYNPDHGLEQLLRFTDPNHPEFWEPSHIIE